MPSRTCYIFSHCDENSRILCQSILENDASAVIYIRSNDRPKHRLVKELRTSIRELDERFLRRFGRVRIVLCDPDEDKNTADALFFADLCRDRIAAEIYVFASGKESECLLDAVDRGGFSGRVPALRIRRINSVRNAVYELISSTSPFDNALELYGEKSVNILILGLGAYGSEFLRAMLWCGQMHGYVLKIHVFDRSPDAESAFMGTCPGIRARGDQPRNGEDYCELRFHSGIDVLTETFTDSLAACSDTTWAFVSLGDERKNLECAMRLRAFFSGVQIDSGLKPTHSSGDVQSPRITAVIADERKSALLRENRICNFKGQYYDIGTIGSRRDIYSYAAIFEPESEKIARAVHLQWGDEESFEQFEYYRRSSAASAIHKRYRDAILGGDEELKAMNEHMRWCAYMRSTEGYTFGYVRDDLAGRHSSLVKYSLLDVIEKEKDRRAISVSDKTEK